jgi:hypothetical protein
MGEIESEQENAAMSMSPPDSPNPINSPRGNPMALASVIMGALGCLPFISGIAAIWLGVKGLRKTADPRIGGRGLAVGGIVLGLASLIISGVVTTAGLTLYYGTLAQRSLATNFMAHIGAGGAGDAAALCTADMGEPRCAALIAQTQPWGQFLRLTHKEISTHADKGRTVSDYKGVATFAAGEHALTLHMVKQGDRWLVDKAEFDPAQPVKK